MILFRLADLPRAIWRLPRALPALPDAADGGPAVRLGLRPALLDSTDGATLERANAVIAAYAGAVGHARGDLRALDTHLEQVVGDYRLARCLARCVEEWYTFAPPPVAAPLAPPALRALIYARAGQHHDGYVPAAARIAFLADLAAELGCTPAALEDAMRADTPARALLVPRGGAGPSPGEVARLYNAAAVATVLAASAFTVLRLPASGVATLKELYRQARGLRVGVDLSLDPGGLYVRATLYGPGSRALVRLREAAGGDEPDGDDGEAGAPAVLPAAGGPALALVVASLARRYPGLTGHAHLLGPDRRPYHYPLDATGMAALADRRYESTAEETEAPAYDSMVEADFAGAFLAQQAGGRMGLARGWTMEREPRPIIAGATVFLPDFGFRRGDVEVLCEVVGYYTEDYLARKRRKLADLRGRIPLLLVADETLASHVAGSGFPTITYRAGRPIRVTQVVAALDREFDPFARRRAAGQRALRALCAAPGQELDEEALCAATGCAGRDELQALWDEVAGAETLARRYVPGQGLVSSTASTAAAALLTQRLTAAGGCLPLPEALGLCREAGLPAPDDALLAHLGVEVRRQGLFDDAQACLPGTPTTPDPAPAPPRARKRRAPS